MSRLRSLHIPFVTGADESVDSKVLPDGVFASMTNCRLNRTGDLRLRRGWRPLDMSAIGLDLTSLGDSAVTTDLYSVGASLVALVKPADEALQLQTYTAHNATIPWVRNRDSFLTPITEVRNVGNMPDLEANVYRASAAVTSDGVYGAVLQQTSSKTVLRVFKMATDETLYYEDSGLVVGGHVSKVVSLGTSFGVVRNSGSALFLQIITTDITSSPAEVSLVSATVTQFDVATAGETTPTALHLVYVVGGEISYAQFNLAGTQVGSTKQVLASGGGVAYVASDDVTAHVAYQAAGTGELSVLSFAATGSYTTSAGPTALDAGQEVEVARFAIALETAGSDSIAVAANLAAVGVALLTTNVYTMSASTHASLTETAHNSTELGGGWVVSGPQRAFVGLRGPLTSGPARDAVLIDNDQPWFVGGYGQSRRYAAFVPTPGVNDAPYAPGRSPSSDALVLFPRQSDTSLSSNKGDGGQATLQVSTRACRVGDVTTRRPGVAFAGALYVTGGMLTQYVASGVAENGFLQPVLSGVSTSNSTGSVGAGTYSYRALVRWRDEAGRTHLSPMSLPVEVEYTAPSDTGSATVHVAKTLRRDSNLITNPVVELYRTEAGPGELFYLVASAPITATTSDIVTLTDELADADIIDNKRPYTEGEFGTTSGALDVSPAPSSRFAVAVRDRLVLADRGPAYQLSQIALPEEAVAFTQPGVSGPSALAYQDAVEGVVTGLASLDDDIVIGTATQLFVTNATGGPNLSGVGEFPSPSRLPSDVGMLSGSDAAIVEDAAGLWFLATADKLYVLPRGQATPTWAGRQVQTQLAGGSVVGAGRDTEDDVTVWALNSAVALWRTGVENAWGRDTLPFTPKRFISHQGRLCAVASDGVVWAQEASAFGDGTSGATAVVLQFETGDFSVFGLAGHGRLALVELLGEFRSAATLAVEISYDSGATWASAVTHTITGLSVGAQFQRQVDFARQRGGKFRLRVTMTPSSTTAEGCRLTGLSLYYTVRSGQTRLPSASRK